MQILLRTGLLAFALLASACATRSPSTAAAAAQPATLLLVSVDGLRPADVTPAQMPVLDALGNANVRAEGMRPSYPSLTFPNHYTLVTGRRPDHHGIIHNSMEDARLGEFRLSNRGAVGNGDGGRQVRAMFTEEPENGGQCGLVVVEQLIDVVVADFADEHFVVNRAGGAGRDALHYALREQLFAFDVDHLVFDRT